jgi:two-component system, OmpR family, sensor histidine kinase KdpD
MPPRADVLLALAKKEGRGKLKIFLGAAPGVGKDLRHARRCAHRQSRDVVVGLVETHGRIETETLLQGLEVLPRKPIVYRNLVVNEFDLDMQPRPNLHKAGQDELSVSLLNRREQPRTAGCAPECP